MKHTVDGATGQFLGRGPITMERTEIGVLPNGDTVVAATDAAGPQIVISGSKTHLLSQRFESHVVAVLAGEFILAAGTPDIYPGWTDMKNGSLAGQLFAVFCGV